MIKYVFGVACLILINPLANAQTGKSRVSKTSHYYNPKISSFSWHGGYGYGAYSGDLSSFLDFGLNNNTLNMNFSGGVTYRHSHFFSLRTELIRYTLRSLDKFPSRNVSFSSGNWEVSSQIIYDIVHQGKIDKGAKIQPFVFLGVGLTWFEPIVSGGKKPGDITKSSFPLTPVIPGGLGVKFYTAKNIYLVLEVGGRFSFSDKLDGVSSDKSTLFNDNYILYGAKLGWSKAYGQDHNDYQRNLKKRKKTQY
jgi:hypothetical protein